MTSSPHTAKAGFETQRDGSRDSINAEPGRRLKRHPYPRRIVTLVGALLLAAFALAASAQATDITNPAQHPYPITVTIDGQTYHDGLDTLPGYDDYACTPIPDVQYDFADNEVLYYNDQGTLLATAPWTEWSRISSYKTWLAQQGGTSTTSTKSSTTSTSSSNSSKGSTTKGSSTNSASKQNSSSKTASGSSNKNSTSKTSTTATGASQTSTRAGASKAKHAKAKHAKQKHKVGPKDKRKRAEPKHVVAAATGGGSGGGGTAVQAGQSKATAAAATAAIAHGTSNTRLAGVVILLALIATGVGLVLAKLTGRTLGRHRADGVPS